MLNMEYFVIYLIGQADTLKAALGGLSFFILLILCPTAFCIRVNDGDIPKAISISIIGAIIAGIISLFIPSTKTALAMAVIPPVINNEQVQKLPENVLGFINDYLEEKRSDLQEFRGSSGNL